MILLRVFATRVDLFCVFAVLGLATWFALFSDPYSSWKAVFCLDCLAAFLVLSVEVSLVVQVLLVCTRTYCDIIMILTMISCLTLTCICWDCHI